MDSRILDEAKLEELGKDLIELINKSTEERLYCIFRNVQFMSSSMCCKLVLVQKKCKEFKVHLEDVWHLAGRFARRSNHQAPTSCSRSRRTKLRRGRRL